MDLAEEPRNTSSSTSVVLNCISRQFELIRSSEVVAVIGFAREGSHFDLVNLYVLPAHRGSGAARELVTSVLEVITASSATVSTSCAYMLRIATSDEYAHVVATPPPAASQVRPGGPAGRGSSIESRFAIRRRSHRRDRRGWHR